LKRHRIADLIEKYVDELKAKDCIKSEAVERAFRKVERHRLLEIFYVWDKEASEKDGQDKPIKQRLNLEEPDSKLLQLVYSDEPLVTKLKGGIPTSSTSQPALVAQMLELLELKEGLKVLEIGAGTGYNAALMAEIVLDQSLITTIDVQEDVVKRTKRLLKQSGYGKIKVLARDGFFGYSKNAPYDRIIATVGCTDISPHWIEQLAPDGFMLIPLQHGGINSCPLVRIWKEDSNILGKVIGWSGFMIIQGELYRESPWAPVYWTASPPKDLPLKEYPIFTAFQEKDRWIRLHLHYFFALNDARTFENQYGMGLWDQKKGVVLITWRKESQSKSKSKSIIQLYGDESLYQDLQRLYEEWEKLGKPKASDYRIEFLPLSKPASLNTRLIAKKKKGKNIWIIERKFFCQVIRLASS